MSAYSPVTNWWPVQAIPCLRPTVLRIGFSNTTTPKANQRAQKMNRCQHVSKSMSVTALWLLSLNFDMTSSPPVWLLSKCRRLRSWPCQCFSNNQRAAWHLEDPDDATPPPWHLWPGQKVGPVNLGQWAHPNSDCKNVCGLHLPLSHGWNPTWLLLS